MYEMKTKGNRIQNVAYFLWEDNSASNKIHRKGPFIFYEVGGAGGIWGGVTQKKRP